MFIRDFFMKSSPNSCRAKMQGRFYFPPGVFGAVLTTALCSSASVPRVELIFLLKFFSTTRAGSVVPEAKGNFARRKRKGGKRKGEGKPAH